MIFQLIIISYGLGEKSGGTTGVGRFREGPYMTTLDGGCEGCVKNG